VTADVVVPEGSGSSPPAALLGGAAETQAGAVIVGADVSTLGLGAKVGYRSRARRPSCGTISSSWSGNPVVTLSLTFRF
jgi:hypothetical protein